MKQLTINQVSDLMRQAGLTEVTPYQVNHALRGGTRLSDEFLNACESPAPRDQILMALREMASLTAKRTESGEDEEMTVTAFMERLAEYPGDIVIDAIRGWPNKSRWWPTWFDLAEQINFWMEDRTRLISRHRRQNDKGVRKTEENRIQMTKVEKDRGWSQLWQVIDGTIDAKDVEI